MEMQCPDVDANAGGSPAAAGASNDRHLLEAAAGGDLDALRQLCARNLPALRRWALRWLPRGRGLVSDADDLVQSALLRALQRLDGFEVRGSASLLAYLRQILLNELRGELRRERRRGEQVEYIDNVDSAGDPVLEHALLHERERAYAFALQRLNRCQRQHLALRLEHGMSFGEIAAHVGGSEDGARMRVSRALRAMTRQLAGQVA
jgi:RNA polymerase sigma-70 factor (ECF subfamily)